MLDTCRSGSAGASIPRSYPPEFRRKVLDLVEAGRPIKQIAELLGSNGQAFLRPPDAQDRLPPDHLSWAIIDAVGGLDLGAFLAGYRRDDRSRPARK